MIGACLGATSRTHSTAYRLSHSFKRSALTFHLYCLLPACFMSKNHPLCIKAMITLHRSGRVKESIKVTHWVHFTFALLPILQELAEEHKGLYITAFFDDVSLLGPPDLIGQALPKLVEGFRECGLQLNQQKCELFYPKAPSCSWAEGMIRSTVGTNLLGRAIGTKKFISDAYVQLVQSDENLLRGIKELKSTQCAFLLLSQCANTKIHHILCLSPPDETAPAASLHDERIASTLAQILGLDHLPEQSRRQAVLQLSSGGLGLSTSSGIQQAAFVASWSASLQALQDRTPSLSTELSQIIEASSSMKSACALRDSLNLLSAPP